MLVINRLAWVSPISAFSLHSCKSKEKHGKRISGNDVFGIPFHFFQRLGLRAAFLLELAANAFCTVAYTVRRHSLGYQLSNYSIKSLDLGVVNFNCEPCVIKLDLKRVPNAMKIE